MKTCVVDQWIIIKVAPAGVMDPRVIMGAMIWAVTMVAPAGATSLRVVITGVITWVRTKETPVGAMSLSTHGQGASGPKRRRSPTSSNT